MLADDDAWVERPTDESRARLDAWCKSAGDILVIEIGAGEDIPTARRFGERVASRFIRINPHEHGVRQVRNAIGLAGTSLDLLSELDRRVGW